MTTWRLVQEDQDWAKGLKGPTGDPRKMWQKVSWHPCKKHAPFRVVRQQRKTYICFADRLYGLPAGGRGDGHMLQADSQQTELLIVHKDTGWNYCYANGEVRVLAHPHIKAKVEPLPAQEGQDEQARKDAKTLHIVKAALALPKPQAAKRRDAQTYVAYYVGAGLIVIAAAAFLIWRRRPRRQSNAA